MPQRKWNAADARLFWSRRSPVLIMRYDRLEENVRTLAQDTQTRLEKEEEEKTSFFNSRTFTSAPTNCAGQNGLENVSESLLFWMRNSSWTFCTRCKLLSTQKLLHNFSNRPITKPAIKCKCRENRYVVPIETDFPVSLKGLFLSDVCILRPIDLHMGTFERLQHGYRQKNEITRISWSKHSVDHKINMITDREAKNRCRKAYDFLMNSDETCYKKFVQMRVDYLDEGKPIHAYDFQETEGIECALWPHLYPCTSWCESVLSGKDSRISLKISFLTKILSGIVDYSLDYELLQFHFDRWIFKTVTGAINSASTMNCSPATALDMKIFSSGYWKWQHRFLVDALRQFGPPSVFVTISPYEWSFPFPDWLDNVRKLTGRTPTGLPAFETLHIAHVLEQVVRGYLCGSNSNRWSQHVFSYNRIATQKNVLTYFYRIEFQQRGTVHLHLLVWLKDITRIKHELIRADFPSDNKNLSFLVHKYQKSDRSCLTINNEPSQFIEQNGKKLLKLYHPREAFVANLRAYITTVLSSLNCSMDFQTTDGKMMVLRYVTSYVSKWKDAYANDSLYSIHVSAYEAAYRHLREFQPCEPEMWLYLSMIKHAWSASRTKRITVPCSDNVDRCSAYTKYKQRKVTDEASSFIEWLRKNNHVAAKPVPYKEGNTLVGIKQSSPFYPEFFFQELILNYPHRSTENLYHPQHNKLPKDLKFFASAIDLLPDLKSVEAVRKRFEGEGHRESYVETVVSHFSSLHDILKLWRLHVITAKQLSLANLISASRFPLVGLQLTVLNFFKNALRQQSVYYSSAYPCNLSDSSDEESVRDNDCEESRQDTDCENVDDEANEQNVDWKRFILVTGKPGTGKTHVMYSCIEHCIEQERKVLVAAPTGYLASQYRAQFGDDVTCDTIHSAFRYPVSSDELPLTNWSISDFDVVVIDEASMISKSIFDHVIRTINTITVRPLVLISGDNAQQQPIETVANKTKQVPSIMDEPAFYAMVTKFNLTIQHRCDDVKYQQFLNHIRTWQPSQNLLDDIQEDRIQTTSNEPTDDDIIQAIKDRPEAVILTVSRNACLRVNHVISNALFADENPLDTVQCDDEMPPVPIYKDMRVMITQNRNKAAGVVNGQLATIHLVENNTVVLRLNSGRLVTTYPVTYDTPNGVRKTVYPFMPSYGLTICKAQGQTLNKLILWFDVDFVPPGTGYVALSRVKRLNDLLLLTKMTSCHIIPV